MSKVSISTRQTVQKDILAQLVEAQKQRKVLNYEKWIVLERETMVTSVNRWRIAFGLPLATADDILRVEQFAIGHVDYSTKWALYCAELACGDRDIQP